MTKNEEYLSYVDYLKSINFQQKLEILKDKYGNKKIIIYGIGLLLDAILDNYDVKKYLNIIGITDKRILDDSSKEYKGFNLYKTSALRALRFSVILDSNVLFEDTKKYLKKNFLVKKTIKIDKFIQITFKEKLQNVFCKIISLFKYLIASRNIGKTLRYTLTCTAEEICCKTNYIDKICKLQKSEKPIRTVFVCSDITNTEFVNLYNLLMNDNNFKVFPIIVTPDELLEPEKINEEKMQYIVNFFNGFETKVIDGIDRETRELPSIHAFKPDLIFYQQPIYIKDDYAPSKMSKNALTFNVVYDIRMNNFDTIGSKYFRKQISNLWKVFINNNDDKILFSQYTDTDKKDIVCTINKNFNTGIIKYLKKTLKR